MSTELHAAKMRILQVIRMEKQEHNTQAVELLREALELIDRQIKKRPDAGTSEPPKPVL